MITLKNVMRANAASCIVFGLIFLFIPSAVAVFLGGEAPAPDWVFSLLGAVLLFNGLHLIWVSTNSMPNKLWILYFSFGDFLWVIATILLLVLGVWITEGVGILASIVVAAVVGAFGLLQMFKRKAMGNC
ncbi:hypothetical protein ABFY09_14695 [Marinomonas sp. 5E14-1]|uniref:hypothetical protein n=1 Tax=Marinomonas sp. 5E14-1 TaxID=3153922 RepID=UPI00326787AA